MVNAPLPHTGRRREPFLPRPTVPTASPPMSRFIRRALFAAGAALAALAPAGAAAQAARALPPIRHVFVIMLENQGYDTTFGPRTRAPYLAHTLARAGALLRQYYGIGHLSLDNYIAMISGIAPNPATQKDCGRYVEFVQTGTAGGQPIGTGCVYPASIETIGNQLDARHLTWKAYMEDMGRNSKREPAACGHPVIGTRDRTQHATATDQYAAKHDPFVYFHAVIDDSTACRAHVVPLAALVRALRAPSTTPNYAFITPSLCHDGHDRPCVDGEPGGLVSADAFLRRWVPRITRSPAFRAGGLLIVTFDEALSIDATSCCDEQPGPSAARPGINGPGGGRIGAVVVSPFIAPGTVSDVPYNHYAFLRTVEDLFGLPHLGEAARDGLATFGGDVFTRAPAARHAGR